MTQGPEGNPRHQHVSAEVIPDVLADRYASSESRQNWSPTGNVIAERDLWIAVMKAQSELGMNIPAEAITAHERARDDVDLDSIRTREEETKHDVKARLEEFNGLAGHEYAHLGMTARDLTDNVEQMRIKRGMVITRGGSVATLARLSARATEHAALTLAARSHNVPAQPTLLGKRFANLGEEMLIAHNRLEGLIDEYPLRGIKGPVGTQTDPLQLLRDPEKVALLEEKIAEHLGFKNVLGSVGQIYPRSLDYEVASALVQLTAAPSNMTNMIRLMAGHEQMDEGFSEGQTGSSGMPHKVNTRTSERIYGLHNVIKGFEAMIEGLTGNQWLEGDVSDSVTRRVAIPGAFLATDGLFEATLHVLDEASVYPAVLQRELDRYMPFLTSTRVLMAAVDQGTGREVAHKAIKRHAVSVAKRMKQEGIAENNLHDLLAQDSDLGLTRDQIDQAVDVPQEELVGRAPQQIVDFTAKVDMVVAQYPDEAAYQPEPLL